MKRFAYIAIFFSSILFPSCLFQTKNVKGDFSDLLVWAGASHMRGINPETLEEEFLIHSASGFGGEIVHKNKVYYSVWANLYEPKKRMVISINSKGKQDAVIKTVNSSFTLMPAGDYILADSLSWNKNEWKSSFSLIDIRDNSAKDYIFVLSGLYALQGINALYNDNIYILTSPILSDIGQSISLYTIDYSTLAISEPIVLDCKYPTEQYVYGAIDGSCLYVVYNALNYIEKFSLDTLEKLGEFDVMSEIRRSNPSINECCTSYPVGFDGSIYILVIDDESRFEQNGQAMQELWRFDGNFELAEKICLDTEQSIYLNPERVYIRGDKNSKFFTSWLGKLSVFDLKTGKALGVFYADPE